MVDTSDNISYRQVGLQPLHHAAERGQTLLMDICLLRGANINALDSKRKSPLHWSSYAGHTRAVEWLLANGADPWIEDDDSCLALHWAFGQGNIDTVKVYLENAAFMPMLDHKNKAKMTPMEFCATRAQREEYEFYRKKYKACETNAAVMRRWQWIQRDLLCGFVGKIGDLVEVRRFLSLAYEMNFFIYQDVT